MQPNPAHHTLRGEEKEHYLQQLDNALRVLVKNIPSLQTSEQLNSLRVFGEKEKWDWKRLANKPSNVLQTLAQLVERVRQEYSWFQWRSAETEPTRNRGYFETLDISAETGLPWVYEFINLHRLQKEAAPLLQKNPDYPELAVQLRSLLVQDYAKLDEVPAQAQKFHHQALQRSFLEQLSKAELLGWESTEHSLKPQATKIFSLGGEELWSLSLIRYSLASGMFQSYVVDVWQDLRDKQIKEVQPGGLGKVSTALDNALKFGEDNAAWYIIQSIDDKFPSLHPVHVSRLLLGPLESKYLTKPDRIEPLPIGKELLVEDPAATLFRCSRQYSYAPNHYTEEGELRQILYREDWRDEVIVCPARYASRVAGAVLGTNVKVLST